MLTGGSNWDDLIARPTTDGANELMYTFGGGEQHALRGDYVSDLLARPVEAAPGQYHGLPTIAATHNSASQPPNVTGAASQPVNMRVAVPATQAAPTVFQSSHKSFDFMEQMQELRAKVEALSRAAPRNMLQQQPSVVGFGQPPTEVHHPRLEQAPWQVRAATNTTVERGRAPSPEQQFIDHDGPEHTRRLVMAQAPKSDPAKENKKRALECISRWKHDLVASDRKRRNEAFRKLPSEFSKDGNMMFKYHAIAGILEERLLKQFDKGKRTLTNEHLSQLLLAWDTLPKEEKAIWKEANSEFKKCLDNRGPKIHRYLDLWGASRFSKKHGDLAKQAVKHLKAPQANGDPLAALREAAEISYERSQGDQALELNAKPSKQSSSVALPILRHFGLEDGWDAYPKQMAQLTLEHIDIFLTDAPALATRLRWSNTLIDYDPKVDTAYGIWARLSTALSSDRWPSFCDGKGETRAMKVENLLLPFFSVNATSQKFADLVRGKEGYFNHKEGYATKFAPATAWMVDDHLERHQPLSANNKFRIVRSVLRAIRLRVVTGQANWVPATGVAKQDADSLLGQTANVAVQQRSNGSDEQFSIESDETGFAETLLHCFDREGLQSEEYEELLEQQLYSFDRYTNGQFQLQQTPLAWSKTKIIAPDSGVPANSSSAKRRLEQDAAPPQAVKRVKQEASHYGGSSPANPWTPFVAKDPRLLPMPGADLSPTEAQPRFTVDVVGELPNARFSRENQLGAQQRHGYLHR